LYFSHHFSVLIVLIASHFKDHHFPHFRPYSIELPPYSTLFIELPPYSTLFYCITIIFHLLLLHYPDLPPYLLHYQRIPPDITSNITILGLILLINWCTWSHLLGLETQYYLEKSESSEGVVWEPFSDETISR
jgi:hypothetical protein